jgi:hypothetical protein
MQVRLAVGHPCNSKDDCWQWSWFTSLPFSRGQTTATATATTRSASTITLRGGVASNMASGLLHLLAHHISKRCHHIPWQLVVYLGSVALLVFDGNPFVNYTIDRLCASLLKLNSLPMCGRYSYSNYAYGLLGYLLTLAVALTKW